MDKIEDMRYYVDFLNKANHAYYNEDREIMSNYAYDAMFDLLLKLERETGVVLPDSPTQHAGYPVVSKLKKITHEFPALSLDKTKSRDDIKAWLGDKEGCLSWKMDGLTVVATYENGKLVSLTSRGEGYVGEDCTHNAKFVRGLPQTIDYTGKLVVRGEATMTYEEFERINAGIEDVKKKYKNPRNLASATVRMLDSKEFIQREIWFSAFNLVYIDDIITNSFCKRLNWLSSYGFNTVDHHLVNKNNLISWIDEMEADVETNKFPSDGLVLMYDDFEYGRSLGYSGKYEKCGFAFKWKDEIAETTIREIKWSGSRTGLLNPIAIFDPVDLEGTTVERASLHNVSIMKAMNITPNSKVEVYKANMIIPQIASVIEPYGNVEVPEFCPICGYKTDLHKEDDVETLYCSNPDCPAKNIGIFTHFVSREAMNIVGLSEATIEKFINNGFISSFADIYRLSEHENEIIEMDGFGQKSYDNLIEAIENSRKTKFERVLCAIGIPGIGKDMAKTITKALGPDPLNAFVEKLRFGESFDNIDGVGPVINDNIYKWKANRKNGEDFADLVDQLIFINEEKKTETNSSFSDKTFVITGSVSHFKNRDEIKEYIEKKGGKVAGSVSAKTSYLVNNDITSNSGKNKKAKELGITIITEEDLLNL